PCWRALGGDSCGCGRGAMDRAKRSPPRWSGCRNASATTWSGNRNSSSPFVGTWQLFPIHWEVPALRGPRGVEDSVGQKGRGWGSRQGYDAADYSAYRDRRHARPWWRTRVHLRRAERIDRPHRALEGRDLLVDQARGPRVLEGRAQQQPPVRALSRRREQRLVRRARL